MPFTFVTKEVAEATCECLLEQAEQAELIQQPQATAERMILEEFGRCLMRIISSAGKTDCPSINCLARSMGSLSVCLSPSPVKTSAGRLEGNSGLLSPPV